MENCWFKWKFLSSSCFLTDHLRHSLILSPEKRKTPLSISPFLSRQDSKTARSYSTGTLKKGFWPGVDGRPLEVRKPGRITLPNASQDFHLLWFPKKRKPGRVSTCRTLMGGPSPPGPSLTHPLQCLPPCTRDPMRLPFPDCAQWLLGVPLSS